MRLQPIVTIWLVECNLIYFYNGSINLMEVSVMSEKRLGENIVRYRNEKGLSQEKIAEYIGVSRQAVTKWESNISRPSSDNLFKLAEILEISVDDLLNNKRADERSDRQKYKNSKMPWLFIGITIVCVVAYIVISSLNDRFSLGALICMFVIGFPIQLFLHIYFSNVIDNDSFSTVAGFDKAIEYNIDEVKKLLTQLDIHIGILSTVYVFLLSALNCFNLSYGWINGLLIILYALNFFATIMINNYKVIDQIYIHDEDKIRAMRSILVTAVYILLLFAGIGIMTFLFETKGIENNTAPAMKLCGLLLSGAGIATAGFFLENNNIKKWDFNQSVCKTSKLCIISFVICLLLYGIMFAV